VHHHLAELPMGGDLVLLFGASVLGSAHCLAMCGPYVAMCTAQFAPGVRPCGTLRLRVLFNLGRIATYSLIGLLVGAFGQIAQAVAGRYGISGIVAIAAGGAALVFGLSMIGWFRDPARLVTMAGLGRWLIAGRSVLNRAPPAAAPVLLGACKDGFPRPGVRGGEPRVARRHAPHGRFHHAGVWAGNVARGFALTLVPQRLLRRVRTQRLAGVLLAGLGALLIMRGLASFGLCRRRDGVMSTTHAGVICGLASRQCAHCRLPLPARPHRETDGEETLLFCCVGCVLVFRVIGSAGEGGAPTGFWRSSVSPHSSAAIS